MQRRALPLLLAAVAAFALALAPAAFAGPKMEVGLQDDDVFTPVYGTFFDREKALDIAKGLNVSWIRVQVVWANAIPFAQAKLKKQPKKVTYDFSRWDSLIASAKKRGIHVQVVLTGPAPAYATQDRKIGVYAPNAKQYAQYVKVAVKHFKKSVTRFSLWNEPNWIGWLKPVSQQPKLYRALYSAAYPVARAADPKAQILFGETSAIYEKGLATAPLKLLRGVLCVDAHYKPIKKMHCKPLSANGYAAHPYDTGNSPTHKYPGADNVTIGTLSRLTTALDKFQKAKVLKVVGAKKMPVYLTEFGYRTTGGRKATPESKRPAYLVKAFNIALKNSRVKQLTQYQLIQPPTGPHFFWQSYLLHQNGKASPTYTAFLKWTKAEAKAGRITKPRPF